MVARVRPEPDALVVVFERDGEEPVRIEAINGEKALIRALIILLAHSKLHAGDYLRVEPADDGAQRGQARRPPLPMIL